MEFLSLKDHVYNFIAEQIRLGKLNSNEKVNEQDICQQLNISRTPVREALIQLAADGFLDSAPRRGFRVKPLTKKESEDIYRILAPLDALAAELAANYLTPEDLKSMESQGVEILTCGTCLNFYGLSEKLQVGSVTNMYEIVERMTAAKLLVRP